MTRISKTALLLAGLGSTALAQPAAAQGVAALQTTPERTKFEETSTHADVLAFVKAVDAASTLIHLDTMGVTNEGRVIPLLVVGKGLKNGSPEAVMASGKLRVYLQGNIHAGEVEGKETLQMLLRDLAQGKHSDWLETMVLLVVPIYNGDGNEKFALKNRGRQHGPLKGMGVRPNAQNLDLNRDHMKLESPEARSVANMLNRYDPHLGVDLHTTDGSFHAYYLTYAPPLHPGTNARITSILRDKWFPQLTKNVREKHGWDYYYYGNVDRGTDSVRTWGSFDYRPRFNNNYLGLRNRFAILSEAYSYATFEDRIKATNYFVDEVLDYAHANGKAIRAAVEQADKTSLVGKRLPVRAQMARGPAKVQILMGEVIREPNPYSGDTIFRRADVKKPEMMYDGGTFTGTEDETVPRAYFIPPAVAASNALKVLQQHGIRTRTLARDTTVQAERFRIDSTSVAARPFQGHTERNLAGAYEQAASVTLPAGTVVIALNQPLSRLAFYLIEPRADDGLVDWNYLDTFIEGQKYYPIVRVR